MWIGVYFTPPHPESRSTIHKTIVKNEAIFKKSYPSRCLHGGLCQTSIKYVEGSLIIYQLFYPFCLIHAIFPKS